MNISDMILAGREVKASDINIKLFITTKKINGNDRYVLTHGDPQYDIPALTSASNGSFCKNLLASPTYHSFIDLYHNMCKKFTNNLNANAKFIISSHSSDKNVAMAEFQTYLDSVIKNNTIKVCDLSIFNLDDPQSICQACG